METRWRVSFFGVEMKGLKSFRIPLERRKAYCEGEKGPQSEATPKYPVQGQSNEGCKITYNLRQISSEGLGNLSYSCLFPSPHFNVGSVLHVAREFPSFFDLHTFNIEVGGGGGRGKDAKN